MKCKREGYKKSLVIMLGTASLLSHLRPVVKVNVVVWVTVPLGSWLEAVHVYCPWSAVLADSMVSVLWT